MSEADRGDVRPFVGRTSETSVEKTTLLADEAFQGGLKASLGVLVVLGMLALAYLTWDILKAFLVSIVLATMLWPWVSRIGNHPLGTRGWRLPRGIAVGLIYLISVAVIGTMVWLVLSNLLPWIDRLMSAFPQQTAFLHAYLDPFRSGNVASGAMKVAGAVAQASVSGGASAATGASSTSPSGPVNVGAFALGLFGGIASTALVLIFTFFLLLDGHRVAQWALFLVPRDHRPALRVLGIDIRDRVSRWVLATAIYSALSGAIVGGAMWLLHVPSPLLFGVGAALMALIPGLGPASITVLAFFASLGLSTWQPLAVGAFGAVLYVLDATLIAPKIFGNMLRLPMLVVFLAILLGTTLLGIWGAILALPVAVATQMVILELMGRRKSEPA